MKAELLLFDIYLNPLIKKSITEYCAGTLTFMLNLLMHISKLAQEGNMLIRVSLSLLLVRENHLPR